MTFQMPRALIEARTPGKRWDDGRHQLDGRQSKVRLAGIAVVASAIFAFDTFTQMSSAIAVLYVLVLLAIGGGRTRAHTWRLGLICVFLSVASFLSDHTPLSDPASALRLLFSVVAILTTTLLLERNLETRQRHEAQALLLDEAADAIVLRDLEGEVLLWNRGAERLYGYTSEQIVGRRLHELLKSHFDAPQSVIDAALHDNDAWNGEVGQVRSDGSPVCVSSRWTLQRNGRGEAWAVLESSTDISAGKAADRALRQSEFRYRNIFETLAVGIIEYDFSTVMAVLEDGRLDEMPDVSRHLSEDATTLERVRCCVRVVNANHTALAMMEDACPDAYEDRDCDFLPLPDEALRSCIVALEAGNNLFERDVLILKADGTPMDLSVSLRIPSDPEDLCRVQCSIVDLTERKRLADEVARMRSELEQAMRLTALGEVSVTIAHEVNQPLAAISAYAEAGRRWLAREPADVDEARAALREVAHAAGHAGDIVKGMRRLLSRAAREDLPIDIDALIQDAMKLASREFLDSGVELSMDLKASGTLVLGDRLLLQQAVINLAVNAMHALQGVPLAQRSLTIDSVVESGSVHIVVHDTGPGFSPEMLPKALNAFVSSKPDGMGLGLAICRSAAEAHDGDIRIGNSDLGGAIVRMRLPIVSSATSSPDPEVP